MTPTLLLEISANLVNALSIFLAGRNNVHTWWSGILGCLLFAQLFYEARLYADVALQFFFIAASAVGWWRWLRGRRGGPLRVRRTPWWLGLAWLLPALVVAAGYGLMLHHYTDAYAPYWDSLVLTFSVIAQFLLVGRRIENWWCWLLVNTIAVPLYASRGLYITMAFYSFFWVNAIISLRHWRKLLREQELVAASATAPAPA
ncbi:MAG TPA: nicotinamide riboside transporter PnuC [Verrucomicrobium sp.]|nr:nicotinamide riboside transporter PnuC [Verrucomicrobium sp.]